MFDSDDGRLRKGEPSIRVYSMLFRLFCAGPNSMVRTKPAETTNIWPDKNPNWQGSARLGLRLRLGSARPLKPQTPKPIYSTR